MMTRNERLADHYLRAAGIVGVYAEAGMNPLRAGPVSDALLDLAVGSALRTSAWETALGERGDAALASALSGEDWPLTRAAMSGFAATGREQAFRRTVLLLLESMKAT